MSFSLEKVARWIELFGIPIALVGIVVTGLQSQRALEEAREATFLYQEGSLCLAYQEQVIRLHLDGYDADDIRSTFLGQRAKFGVDASAANAYDEFLSRRCGTIEIVTKNLPRPPPPKQP